MCRVEKKRKKKKKNPDKKNNFFALESAKKSRSPKTSHKFKVSKYNIVIASLCVLNLIEIKVCLIGKVAHTKPVYKVYGILVMEHDKIIHKIIINPNNA